MNDFFNILFGNGKQEEVGETELIGSHSLQLKDRTNKARQTLIANREENRPEAPYPTAGHSAKAPYELDIDPEFQVPERPEAPHSSHYTAFAKDKRPPPPPFQNRQMNRKKKNILIIIIYM